MAETRSKYVYLKGLTNVAPSEIIENYKLACSRQIIYLEALAILTVGRKFRGLMVFDKRTRYTPIQFDPIFQPVKKTYNDAMDSIVRYYNKHREFAVIQTYGSIANQIQARLMHLDRQDNIFFITISHQCANFRFEELLAQFKPNGIIAIQEEHKDGTPHIHAVVSFVENIATSALLAKISEEFGSNVSVQAVNDLNKVIAYILKTNPKPFEQTGVYKEIKVPTGKVKNSDLLATIIEEIVLHGKETWEYITSSDVKKRVVAFKNKKGLDELAAEAKKQRAQRIIPNIPLPQKPTNPEMLKIWQWLFAIKTRRAYEPTFAPRHLYLCGRPNTRKSSFASYLQAGFRTFLTNVADPWWDGYNDNFDICIIDEFTIIDPNRNGKCLVTLNRFMESARGQPLPIKYSGVSKFNVTMPVLVISNLTRDAMRAAAYKYFDESQVAAFERRFTFVDIGSVPIPLDFTYINLITKREDFSAQFDSDEKQQFIVNIRIFNIRVRVWVFSTTASQASSLGRLGIDFIPHAYTAMPIFRGTNCEIISLVMETVPCLPHMVSVDIYMEQCDNRVNFKADFSQLMECVENENSKGTSAYTLPWVNEISFLLLENLVPSLFKPADPMWFFCYQNYDLLYKILHTVGCITRNSLISRVALEMGHKFILPSGLSNDYACPICLSPVANTWLLGSCGHPLHWNCLSMYLENGHMSCPVCRGVYGQLEDTSACCCDECAPYFRQSGVNLRRH